MDKSAKAKDAGFKRGVAVVLAEVQRTYGEDVIVSEILRGLCLKVADLKAAGADEYDLEEIRKAVSDAA